MHIWIDADACPAVIKEILFRAAQRTGFALTLVANRPIAIPRSPHIKMRCVSAGFDVADQEIVASLAPGDLVISSDIPLAADVLAKGGHVLSPRGEQFTTDNIRERLSIRDFLDTLRGSGIQTGGPPPFSLTDRKTFADQLDRFLARHAPR